MSGVLENATTIQMVMVGMTYVFWGVIFFIQFPTVGVGGGIGDLNNVPRMISILVVGGLFSVIGIRMGFVWTHSIAFFALLIVLGKRYSEVEGEE